MKARLILPQRLIHLRWPCVQEMETHLFYSPCRQSWKVLCQNAYGLILLKRQFWRQMRMGPQASPVVWYSVLSNLCLPLRGMNDKWLLFISPKFLIYLSFGVPLNRLIHYFGTLLKSNMYLNKWNQDSDKSLLKILGNLFSQTYKKNLEFLKIQVKF